MEQPSEHDDCIHYHCDCVLVNKEDKKWFDVVCPKHTEAMYNELEKKLTQ